MDLILMGLRGSGKSTLARRLSGATGVPFVDLDDRVAAMLGHTTAGAAWIAHGEAAFRATEVCALRETLSDSTPIIALGGGTPMAPGAQEILEPLKRRVPPRIIYLRASADVLAARIKNGPARPSLTGEDPIAEVPVVLAQRDLVYLKLADAVLEISDLSIEQAATALLAYGRV